MHSTLYKYGSLLVYRYGRSSLGEHFPKGKRYPTIGHIRRTVNGRYSTAHHRPQYTELRPEIALKALWCRLTLKTMPRRQNGTCFWYTHTVNSS